MTNIINNIANITESVLKTIINILNIANIDSDNSDRKKFRVSINEKEIDVVLPAYYLYVDSGRKAGKRPPIDVIMEWIIRNKIRLPSGMTLKSYAFLVARVIGRKGVKPRPFIDILLEEISNLVSDEIYNTIKLQF